MGYVDQVVRGLHAFIDPLPPPTQTLLTHSTIITHTSPSLSVCVLNSLASEHLASAKILYFKTSCVS